MLKERVVEITFPDESQGSGYLITPRHVLTARHVAKTLEVGRNCTLRPLASWGDDVPTPAARPARLAWFADPANDLTLDIGIVELERPAPAGIADEPVVWGSVADIELWPFRCAGFPQAAGQGSTTVGGKLAFEPAKGRFNLNVETALPGSWKAWAGLSGSLVFSGGYAVGVVRTVDGNWDGLLTATPMLRLQNHAEFLEYWRKQGFGALGFEEATPFGSVLRERISTNVYLIDREDPVEEVKQRLRELPDVVPSQVFAIEGVEDDEHHHVIKRLAEDHDFQRMLRREAKSTDVIVPLPWPHDVRRVDPDERFAILVKALRSRVGLESPPGTELSDSAALRACFEHDAVPRAFWILIRRKIAFSGHAELLRRVLKLWESLGSGLPVMLFLGLAWDDPEPPPTSRFSLLNRTPQQPEADLTRVFEEATKNIEESVRVTGPLMPIDAAHIDPWIEELGRRCRDLRPGQLDALRISLRSRIAGGKRARQFGAELESALKELN